MYGPDDGRAWSEQLHPRVPAGGPGGGEFGTAPKSGHGEAPAKSKKPLGPPKGTLAYNPGKNHGPGYGVIGGDPHVHELQEALNRLGVTDGRGHKLADDGKLGPLTTQAIKAAQKRLGLRADGRVTPEFYSRLVGLTSLPGGHHAAEPHAKPHHTPTHEAPAHKPAAKKPAENPAPAKKLAVGGSGGNKLRSAMDPVFVRADLHPGDGNAEQLHQYWVHGEGAAKIGWGTPGDFDRCVVQLQEHAHFTPDQAKGYCNLAHHAATGMYPAQHAELEKGHRSAVTSTVGPADAEMEQHLCELLAGMSEADVDELSDLADAYIKELGGGR